MFHSQSDVNENVRNTVQYGVCMSLKLFGADRSRLGIPNDLVRSRGNLNSSEEELCWYKFSISCEKREHLEPLKKYPYFARSEMHDPAE